MHLSSASCISIQTAEQILVYVEFEVSVWAEHQCVVYRNRHVPPSESINPHAVCILNRESCCRWHLFLKCVFVLQKNMRTTAPLCFGVRGEVWSEDHFISDSPRVDLWTKQQRQGVLSTVCKLSESCHTGEECVYVYILRIYRIKELSFFLFIDR